MLRTILFYMKIEKKVPLPLLKRQKKIKKGNNPSYKNHIFLVDENLYLEAGLDYWLVLQVGSFFINVKRGSDTVKVFYSKNI